MKELDFLPEWYRQKDRRKTHYREQYTAVVSLLVIILTWSFFSVSNLNNVEAQCQALKSAQQNRLQSSREFESIQEQLQQLKKKAEILKSVDSKILVSNILGELSFLINGPVILNKVEIKKEKFAVEAGNKKASAADSRNKAEEAFRFHVVIKGIATDAAEVAQLLRKLENSPCFCNVVPGFSRNRIVQGYQVSEFEIYCYIANYSLKK